MLTTFRYELIFHILYGIDFIKVSQKGISFVVDVEQKVKSILYKTKTIIIKEGGMLK